LAKPNTIGMATKKIIVVPCMVNIWLNTCGETKPLCGRANCSRMTIASIPPMIRKRIPYPT
jgi:hypothetical protein